MFLLNLSILETALSDAVATRSIWFAPTAQWHSNKPLHHSRIFTNNLLTISVAMLAHWAHRLQSQLFQSYNASIIERNFLSVEFCCTLLQVFDFTATYSKNLVLGSPASWQPLSPAFSANKFVCLGNGTPMVCKNADLLCISRHRLNRFVTTSTSWDIKT